MTSARPVASDVDPAALKFDDRGLLPVIAQDLTTGTVLMLAWANREAVERTLESGQGWFWSRSRQELWHKGATSGNVLEVAEVLTDCDSDSLLYRVNPAGPACHLGERSCFGSLGEYKAVGEIELGWLWRVLEARKGADPDSSYTARLLAKGRPRIAQKVVEEAGEVVIASLTAASEDPDQEELVGESADLLYHLLVLLLDSGVAPRRVAQRLAERHRPQLPPETSPPEAEGAAS
ncbi:MAG: bifunctional phosphoribosyl-AMP cyclohydrolase/phosphoribosyl-ATP diphosphatase HisIE [Acidobacteriota bacterium]